MAPQHQARCQANDHQRNVVEFTRPVRPAIERDGEDEYRRAGAKADNRLGQVHACVV